MEVILYAKFSKKKNSTARPSSSTTSTTFDCSLKDSTSVLNPVIEISLSVNKGSIYTYAYIPEFERYYYISDWQYNKGLWIASLSVDVLATYRYDIGDYNAFIERSSLTTTSSYMEDPYVSNTAMIDTSIANSYSITEYDTDGCYIVRIASYQDTWTDNGIDCYALTGTELGELLSWLYNSDNFGDILTNALSKAVFNPMNYILSIKWFPYASTSIASEISNIYVGFWDTSITARRITSQGKQFMVRVPSYTHFGDWRDISERFTNIYIRIPGVGVIDIPPRYNSSSIVITGDVDFITGDLVVMLSTATYNQAFSRLTGKFGIDIQGAQLSQNIGGVFSGALSSLGSILSGNILGSVSNVVNTITTALSPVMSTVGNTESRTELTNNGNITVTRIYYISGDKPTVLGYPYMKNATISSISGYVKCSGASVSIYGYDSEKDAVNNYLNNGFYYE